MPHVNHPHPIYGAIQTLKIDDDGWWWSVVAEDTIKELVAAEGDNADTLMDEWWPGETIQDVTYKQIADTIREYLAKKEEKHE